MDSYDEGSGWTSEQLADAKARTDRLWADYLARQGSGPDAKVVVRKDDLLHCLQVAHWRAGLIEPAAGMRLKEALGIGEAEVVPKPGVR